MIRSPTSQVIPLFSYFVIVVVLSSLMLIGSRPGSSRTTLQGLSGVSVTDSTCPSFHAAETVIPPLARSPVKDPFRYSGTDGICEMIADSPAEVVLNSIMGKAGLLPTLTAIKSKKSLALANKESLVVAGDIDQLEICD